MKFRSTMHDRYFIVLFSALFALTLPQIPAARDKTAFSSTRDGTNEIYIMNSDGNNQTRVTNNGGFDLQPSLSPDSSKIANIPPGIG